ncbi:MAG: sodium-translocating pyrophosphatase, partial [Bacteroidales bacterium]|nr:sodium-translocating pyrophosphatase [Bacteroidales bacterium]
MKRFLSIAAALLLPVMMFASEADLPIPDLRDSFFPAVGLTGWQLLLYGFIIILVGILFGVWQYATIRKIPVHQSMLNVSNIIYETCKTYLLQQGKFLIILFLIVGSAITYYFLGLVEGISIPKVLLILFWTVIGIL